MPKLKRKKSVNAGHGKKFEKQIKNYILDSKSTQGWWEL